MLFLCWQIKVKETAVVRYAVALDAYLPTQLLHDLSHDGQPQPIPIGLRPVEPRERLEQAGLLPGR